MGTDKQDVLRGTLGLMVLKTLEALGPQARALGVPLLFEPLNRYETNLVHSVAEGLALLKLLQTPNVKLLVDLFHAGEADERGGDAGLTEGEADAELGERRA